MKLIDEIVSHSVFSTKSSPFQINYELKNPALAVVTGDNASGKSLLRKLLYITYEDEGYQIYHSSQAARSRSGIHRAFVYGSEEDDSTGFNSIKTVLGLIKTVKAAEKKNILVMDEPEIGCGSELQATLGFHLAEQLPLLTNCETCFIITHSTHLTKELLSLDPSHIRLMSGPHDYTSLQKWVSREIHPTDLTQVLDRGRTAWGFVYKLINEGKKK